MWDVSPITIELTFPIPLSLLYRSQVSCEVHPFLIDSELPEIKLKKDLFINETKCRYKDEQIGDEFKL